MVVKILSGGGGFGGIDYNEEKVEKGEAHVVEKINIPGLAGAADGTAAELKEFFEEYSARNPDVSKPQFHVAFSVKGNEMSHEEITDFAKKWMTEMGYAEPGQPMVIYAHHDTGNNHIHVITSRVGTNGYKINDHNERRRGRQVLNRLMGERSKMTLDKNTSQILTTYSFTSVNQFMAIFQTSGYQAYTLNTDVILKRDGIVTAKIPIAEVEKHCTEQTDEVKLRNRRKAWGAGQLLKRIAPNASSREELTASARKRFGLGIVWLGKPDSPYGYMVVDHKSKMVYNGADVWKLKDLQQAFTPMPERLAKAAETVDSTIAQSPGVTTREMNYALARETGGKISKGILTLGSMNCELRPEVKETLKANDRFAWVNSFKPATELERDILCRAMGVDEDEKARINISSDKKEMSDENINRFQEAYRMYMVEGNMQGISNMGMRLVWEEGACYGIDFKKGTMANLNSLGIAQSGDQTLKTETLLAELFGSNPEISTRELNTELMKQTGSWISKGFLKVGNETIPLSPEIKETLKSNDRIARVNSFKPATELERDILCRAMGVDEDEKSRINISSDKRTLTEEEYDRFKDAYKFQMSARSDDSPKQDGLRIVWNDGTGYAIDFKNNIIVDLKEAGIQQPHDLKTRADLIVLEAIHENPDITTRQLNEILLRQTGCRLSKGILQTGEESVPLSPELKQTLKTNDRIDWVNSFKPSTEQERELLHQLSGVDKEKIHLHVDGKKPADETMAFIADVYGSYSRDNLQEGMKRMGLRIELQGGRWYCVDYKTTTLIDLKAHGFDTSMFVPRDHRNVQPYIASMPSAYHKLRNVGNGGNGQKRDWEVGRASEYSDDAVERNQGMSR